MDKAEIATRLSERAAFEAGADWGVAERAPTTAAIRRAARERYPIQEPLPRVVYLPGTNLWARLSSFESACIDLYSTEEAAREEEPGLRVHRIWPQHLAILVDLAQRPFDIREQ